MLSQFESIQGQSAKKVILTDDVINDTYNIHNETAKNTKVLEKRDIQQIKREEFLSIVKNTEEAKQDNFELKISAPTAQGKPLI